MTSFDLNLARVFVAIYETRSVTVAAERLDITQPSVSYSLAKLRSELADLLFVRDKRSLKPTPRAEALYPKFRDALVVIGKAIEETHRFDPDNANRIFNFAMSDVGSMYLLPRIERGLFGVAPHIGLDVRQVPTPEMADQLAAMKIDVALGNLTFLGGQTRSFTLFREHYVCLLGKQYAERIGSMTLDAFRASRHVVVSSAFSGHHLAEDTLTDLGISRRTVIRTPYFAALPQLIAQSDLVVMLPSRIAGIFAMQSGVVALPAPMPLADFEVKMYWHSRHESNPSIAWLLERLIAILREP